MEFILFVIVLGAILGGDSVGEVIRIGLNTIGTIVIVVAVVGVIRGGDSPGEAIGYGLSGIAAAIDWIGAVLSGSG